MMAAVVTILSFRVLAQDEPRPGTFASVIRRIIDNQGGPLGGGLTGGISSGTLNFSQRAACEIVGANCSESEKMGCDLIRNSVISGVKECWFRNSFQLYDQQTMKFLSNQSFTNVANLQNNNTGRTLVLAKKNSASKYVLLNENGEVVADGETLDCDTFEAAGDDAVACVRGDKKFLLELDDLDRARDAALRVDAIAEDVSVNICNIAIESINRGDSDAFFSSMKEYRVGDEKISIYKKTSDLGATCVLEPEGDVCTAIYVTNEGLECLRYGSLVRKRAMSISKQQKIDLVRRLVFKGREVVTMKEIADMSSVMPKIRIDHPDRLLTKDMYISKSRSGRSNKGTN